MRSTVTKVKVHVLKDTKEKMKVNYKHFFFFSSRRRHTRYIGDWSSDVCSSDLSGAASGVVIGGSVPLVSGRTLRLAATITPRSEERRVGKECRSWWSSS